MVGLVLPRLRELAATRHDSQRVLWAADNLAGVVHLMAPDRHRTAYVDARDAVVKQQYRKLEDDFLAALVRVNPPCRWPRMT